MHFTGDSLIDWLYPWSVHPQGVTWLTVHCSCCLRIYKLHNKFPPPLGLHAGQDNKCTHCKNKLVVLTTEWLQTNWRDSGNEKFALVLKTNCIMQPKGQLPSSCYNHNTLTTSEIPSSGSLLQIWSAFVMTPSQMFWGLSVYCGCKMNWVAASLVTLSN